MPCRCARATATGGVRGRAAAGEPLVEHEEGPQGPPAIRLSPGVLVEQRESRRGLDPDERELVAREPVPGPGVERSATPAGHGDRESALPAGPGPGRPRPGSRYLRLPSATSARPFPLRTALPMGYRRRDLSASSLEGGPWAEDTVPRMGVWRRLRSDASISPGSKRGPRGTPPPAAGPCARAGAGWLAVSGRARGGRSPSLPRRAVPGAGSAVAGEAGGGRTSPHALPQRRCVNRSFYAPRRSLCSFWCVALSWVTASTTTGT